MDLHNWHFQNRDGDCKLLHFYIPSIYAIHKVAMDDSPGFLSPKQKRVLRDKERKRLKLSLTPEKKKATALRKKQVTQLGLIHMGEGGSRQNVYVICGWEYL